MPAIHVLVLGRVQGVGFRGFVAREAGALGLAGAVRNLPDGSVDVEAEGERAALESLVESLRRGPWGARVDEVRVTWRDAASGRRGFTIDH